MGVLDNIHVRNGIFDSRDVIDRMAELDSLLSDDDGTDETLAIEREERAALREFVDDMEQTGPSDWSYGEAFIAEWAFEDYARQLAEDIGAIPDDATWPNTYIDWGRAAAALQQDYSEVDIDGTTFYYRD